MSNKIITAQVDEDRLYKRKFSRNLYEQYITKDMLRPEYTHIRLKKETKIALEKYRKKIQKGKWTYISLDQAIKKLLPQECFWP